MLRGKIKIKNILDTLVVIETPLMFTNRSMLPSLNCRWIIGKLEHSVGPPNELSLTPMRLCKNNKKKKNVEDTELIIVYLQTHVQSTKDSFVTKEIVKFLK